MNSLKKIAALYDTDKSVSPGYLSNYEKHFSPIRDQKIALLELGILNGGSLQMWQDYFPLGKIAGLDCNKVEIAGEQERIKAYQGQQQDLTLLGEIASEFAPDGFDIIIDDASHLGELTRDSYRFLFRNHLNPGGIYVIEDWGTGYWANWPDGRGYQTVDAQVEMRNPSLFNRLLHPIQSAVNRSIQEMVDTQFVVHNAGMVGFIKELVDECAMADITHPTNGVGTYRVSRIDEMFVSFGQVFIRKSTEASAFE